ncbi:MAG TPA: Na+/H+ antiporter NhaA [Rhodothermales bacterium]|nr:Na+/H+ antiporter NhaA [Rhodothermales bacterium]
MPAQSDRAIDRVLRPLQEFLRLEAAGGLILMAAAVVALIIANSPLAEYYASILVLPLEVSIGPLGIDKPLLLWINDGLMAVFFFLVGLELKREIAEGHLSSIRAASLPAFGAIGGMALPAAIYAAFNWGDAAAMKGWAIPAATDIAFALGVLSLLGDRVPAALKAFLLSVAIFDDLGAIIIIAIFYTAELSLVSLVVAATLTVGLALLNRFGVSRAAAYVLLGIPLWIAVLKSGVHATLAGVVVAMFIPLRSSVEEEDSDHSGSLLRHLEHALHPWVAFGVLPIFAFANAGVPLGGLSMADVVHPVPLGIILGLFFGKQIGIFLLSWLAVRVRAASLPEGVSWSKIYGASLLCGIGFTMSLFIASLAFEQGGGGYFGLERLGILLGTLVSGLAGFVVLKFALSSRGR